MSEEVRLPIVSRRRMFWLAALAALAVPATMLPALDARAQSDQAPAAEPTAPKKNTKSKTDTKPKSKTKKTTPGDSTAPAANPPAAPKQQ
jgi:hypothetical protein